MVRRQCSVRGRHGHDTQRQSLGPFKAVVQNGVLIGVQALPDLDAMPTKMLTEGLLGRVYHKTRVQYPMIRKSYLADPTGDTKPHLRGKEPFVRVSWEEARAITANAILTTAEKHGNQSYHDNVVVALEIGFVPGTGDRIVIDDQQRKRFSRRQVHTAPHHNGEPCPRLDEIRINLVHSLGVSF